MICSAFALAAFGCAPAPLSTSANQMSQAYTKYEYRIPMRDGVKLYTAVYVPKNTKASGPIMLERTPYSAGPYGPNAFVQDLPGSDKFRENGTIFAFQDVRGRFMSEGKFVEIRPTLPPKATSGIDESTDAFDTVDFLVKNVPQNNGNVGLWGISYPGFYAAAAAVNTHPAIKAISPQAPVSDWFRGDDVHHNGAFFLQDNFDFYFWFGYDMDKPGPDHPNIPSFGARPDAYKFFLELGSAINADTKYYKGKFPFWLDVCNNDSLNAFWKPRALPDHMRGVKCPILTVGGWFDAENLYGALAVYRGVEKLNPNIENTLVMGPWSHGQWAWGGANRLGRLSFGTSESLGTFYREQVEWPFFSQYLWPDSQDKDAKRPEVRAFETGNNKWHDLNEWPPKAAKPFKLYLTGAGKLGFKAPSSAKAEFDSFISDPANPVPYTGGTIRSRPSTYMVEDQRFLMGRKDVLNYVSEPLTEDITLVGPVNANLFVSTSGTDTDVIVKLIDVYPDDAPTDLRNAQILIRGNVTRAKYRKGLDKPAAMKPNTPEAVNFPLNDTFHTFKKGHRIMVQVQASWFPLVDRNTHQFQNLFKAKPEDYKKATIRVYRNTLMPSGIAAGKL